MQPNTWERRLVAIKETRALDSLSSNGRTLTGYAIVFGSLSHDLGGYRELIEPSAVDRTLQESRDVLALMDHDPAKVVGRTTAGTLRLAKDAKGLRVEIDMPDTSYAQDAIELVKRRDLAGMSFSFSVVRPDGERFETRNGQPTRLISDMLIHEVSLVSMPAYAATAVQMQRSTSPVAWLRRKLEADLIQRLHS